MSEQTPKQSFTEVIDRAASYRSGKTLDTLAAATGDTILAPAAVGALDVDDMSVAEQHLRDFLASDMGVDVREQAQAAIVQQRLAEIALIRANHGQATGEIDNSAQIHELQKSLYGHYSPALFRAALRKKIALLETISVPEDLEIAKAQLLDELDTYADSDESGVEQVELEQPRPETLQAIRDWIHSQFEDVFDEIDAIDGDELDAEQLVDILNMAIETTPALRENGWHAKTIQRNKSAVSVFASDREVVVPIQRHFTKGSAKKLVVHEVFGHALRSAIAEMNGDEIGTTGTATYGEFEESFEIALEQCLDGTYDPRRGLDHYITIGLAETAGLSREKIAQLTNSMRQLAVAGDSLTPEKVQKAATMTEGQIRRTFAGLTDVDDGITHRKDINYLHGLNGVWKLLNVIVEAGQVDEGMRWLLAAKFNPYDLIDQRLVSQYLEPPSSIKKVLGMTGDTPTTLAA